MKIVFFFPLVILSQDFVYFCFFISSFISVFLCWDVWSRNTEPLLQFWWSQAEHRLHAPAQWNYPPNHFNLYVLKGKNVKPCWACFWWASAAEPSLFHHGVMSDGDVKQWRKPHWWDRCCSLNFVNVHDRKGAYFYWVLPPPWCQINRPDFQSWQFLKYNT